MTLVDDLLAISYPLALMFEIALLVTALLITMTSSVGGVI